MKKLMSVFVLLMFVGSLIVMTGCFGGDDGIGAIIGAAVFILAISASGGTGAAVFAANTRDSIRPAISFATTKPKIVITPLNADGTEAASSYTIESDKLTAPTADGQPVTGEYQIADNYNQYLVKVYANNQLIHQGIQSVATGQKTGTAAKISLTVDNTSTAKVKVFNNWNKAAARRSYSDFSYNLAAAPTTDITTIAGNVNTALVAWQTDISKPVDFSGVDSLAQTEATKVTGTTAVYSISGYVTQVDGAGSSNAVVYVTGTNPSFSAHAQCVNGYYTVQNIPAGTYTICPSLAHHTFQPACLENVVISNADLASQNFKAVSSTSVTTP